MSTHKPRDRLDIQDSGTALSPFEERSCRKWPWGGFIGSGRIGPTSETVWYIFRSNKSSGAIQEPVRH